MRSLSLCGQQIGCLVVEVVGSYCFYCTCFNLMSVPPVDGQIRVNVELLSCKITIVSLYCRSSHRLEYSGSEWSWWTVQPECAVSDSTNQRKQYVSF